MSRKFVDKFSVTRRIRAIYNPRSAFGNVELLNLLLEERGFPESDVRACGICFAKGFVSPDCIFCQGTGMEDGIAREPEEEQCPDCCGSGEDTCDSCDQSITCRRCDGSGKIEK